MGGNAVRNEDAIIKTFKQKSKAKKPEKPKRTNGIADDADHYLIARAVADGIQARTGYAPVYTQGKLYRFENGVWMGESLDAVAVAVGAAYGGYRFCNRGSDFKAIAGMVAALCANDSYFDEAPIGIAAGDRFWRVVDSKILSEPLAPEHRQRMRLTSEPDMEAEAPLFMGLLDHAFGSDVDQRDLLQILFGGALTHSTYRYRIATLLLGKTTTGKTTLLNVLAQMFPRDQIAATNPQRWGNEYYRASLADKSLNIVGELDAHEPIPGGAFKSVVGCDVIEGRHPTHRPFSFVCTSAHFFNANRLPPTTDRSDAFFKRWRVIEFNNMVMQNDIIENLAERITAEEQPAVLAWMLEGAALLQTLGSIPETAQHKRIVDKWRAANNSALLFLLEACKFDEKAKTKGTELFDSYKSWAMDVGVKAFGRNGFYEAMDEGAGRFGVHRVDHDGIADFHGVQLVGWR